jgi:hypothetical protein
MKPILAHFPRKAVALFLPRLCSAGIPAGIFVFLCPFAPAQSKSPGPLPEILGTWEGQSRCTVPDSPCHDEHVIYEIAPIKDKSAPASLKMDGYKVASGERQFMGTLRCEYETVKKILSCTSRGKNFDDWRFTLSENTLDGILTIDSGKTLYRKITAKKDSGN